MVRRNPWWGRYKRGIAIATAVLAGPVTARAAEDEIEVDLAGVVPQFSRRPTYGAPFKLVVQLQEGTRAVLRYWPMPRKATSCSHAHRLLTGELPPMAGESWEPATPSTATPVPGKTTWVAVQTFGAPRATLPGNTVEDRLGVAGAAQNGVVKVSFHVDRLLTGVPYCFQIRRTVFRPLATSRVEAAQKNLRLALDELVKRAAARADGSTFQDSSCTPEERAEMAREPWRIKGCAVRDEFTRKDGVLARLKVRHPHHGDTVTFAELIQRELAADEAARAEASKYAQESVRRGAEIESWQQSRAGLVDVPSRNELNEALAAVRKLEKFETGQEAAVERARTLACTEPRTEPLCALLMRMKQAYVAERDLAAAGKLEQFSAFVSGVTQVREVVAEAKVMETVEPSFTTRYPLWISLDMGAAVVPFPDGQARLAQHIGVNFYIRPIDRDEPLRAQRHFRGRWFTKRLSLTVGITTTGALLRSEDGVDGVLGKQFVLLGGGFRLTRMLRLGVGALFYRQASQNPTGGPTRTGAAPYFALSLDIDVFNWIRGKLKG